MRNVISIYHKDSFDSRLSEFFSKNEQLKLTSLEKSDLIVYKNVVWGKKITSKILSRISQEYRAFGKKVVVFIISDFEKSYPRFDNLILFRTSLRKSKVASNEYLLPYVWECSQSPFPQLTYDNAPIVGFCGKSGKTRKRIIDVFLKSKTVDCNFFIRKKFWGGSPHDPVVVNSFNENIKNSHFTICNRGAGNFSMRFYQTLAFGRIPVLVNKDMVLPFEDEIDWKSAVIFERNERECLKQVIRKFESGEYLAMQNMAREIFDRYFSSDEIMYRLLSQTLTQ